MKEVILGKGLRNIERKAFAHADRIETIYSLNPIPPICADETVFDEYVYNAGILYVPNERNAIARYKAANVWSKFFEIYDMDMSNGVVAVDEVKATLQANNYYDLQGHRTGAPSKSGVFIKNGKKVLIKK